VGERGLLRWQAEQPGPDWGGKVQAFQPEKMRHRELAVGYVLVRRGFVMKEVDSG